MTRLSRIILAGLLSLALLPACTSTKEQAGGGQPVEPAQVTVHNRNVLDVTVYVLRGTERIRLGMITSGNSEVFTLSEHIVINSPLLRFIADPIGSARSILIEELTVFPGDEIDLWVPVRRL